MSYKLLQHRLFAKEILRVPVHHQKKTYRLFERLKHNPNTLPPNSSYLRGFTNVYRTRIGNLRIVYQIDHPRKRILVLGIGSRGKLTNIELDIFPLGLKSTSALSDPRKIFVILKVLLEFIFKPVRCVPGPVETKNFHSIIVIMFTTI